MHNQPAIETASHGLFYGAVFVVFAIMIMAGALLHGAMKSRGFGTVGNAFFLFVGTVTGVFVMRGIQGLLA